MSVLCLECLRAAAPGKSRCTVHQAIADEWREGWASLREQVLSEETSCWLCNGVVARGEQSVDHVVRRADGGQNVRSNLRLAHKRCNSARG